MPKFVGIDLETYHISAETTRPKPIILSIYDGIRNELIEPKDIEATIKSYYHDGYTFVAHNATFDFGVLYIHYPALQGLIIDLYNTDRIRCTKINQQVYNVAQKQYYTDASLKFSVRHFLNIDISKDKDNKIGLEYVNVAGLPITSWPEELITYSLEDARYTYLVNEKQPVHDPVSIRADFVLGLATERGLLVDKGNIKNLKDCIIGLKPKYQQMLMHYGLLRQNKNGTYTKSKKSFQDYLQSKYPNSIMYSAKGNIITDKKHLAEYLDDEIIKTWLEYINLEKIEGTYLAHMESTDIIRSTFNPIVRTGRTSATSSRLFPSVNLQNLPRQVKFNGVGIRECIKARPGYKLVTIDYSALELCSCAEVLYQFYNSSSMGRAINQGDRPVDLHAFTGSAIMSNQQGAHISYEQFISKLKTDKEYKFFRQLAKPINLGYPGGVGPARVAESAMQDYGVYIDVNYATQLREQFYELFPELAQFLKHDMNKFKTGEKIKVKIKKKVGNVYIETEEESSEYGYTIANITRRGCNKTACSNGVLMQSLSAYGAKQAIWDVFIFLLTHRIDGYILGFIHDELVIELSEKHLENYDTIKYISHQMITGMQVFMPHIRITVEASIMQNWSKENHEWTENYWQPAPVPMSGLNVQHAPKAGAK